MHPHLIDSEHTAGHPTKREKAGSAGLLSGGSGQPEIIEARGEGGQDLREVHLDEGWDHAGGGGEGGVVDVVVRVFCASIDDDPGVFRQAREGLGIGDGVPEVADAVDELQPKGVRGQIDAGGRDLCQVFRSYLSMARD